MGLYNMLILYELHFNYNSIMDSFNLNCNYSDINYDTIAHIHKNMFETSLADRRNYRFAHAIVCLTTRTD